jgi:hypothetical protein
MDQKPTIGDMMAAYASDAVDHARSKFGIALDYSPQSIEQVEQVLSRLYAKTPRGIWKFLKKGPSEEVVDTLCKMYGGYIGEVFRRVHGGHWEIRRDLVWTTAAVIALSRSGGMTFFPPSKVYKRLTDGDGDNVWTYYRVLSRRTADSAG